ncbi:MAG: hypothetical protein IH968_17180 [Gemmatimonadetes bacterium]|nr:hypothetical protein [Gemmatimonadota bacterium]
MPFSMLPESRFGSPIGQADNADEALAHGFTEQPDYEAALVIQRDHPATAERWDGTWAIAVGIYSDAKAAHERLAKKGSSR